MIILDLLFAKITSVVVMILSCCRNFPHEGYLSWEGCNINKRVSALDFHYLQSSATE